MFFPEEIKTIYLSCYINFLHQGLLVRIQGNSGQLFIRLEHESSVIAVGLIGECCRVVYASIVVVLTVAASLHANDPPQVNANIQLR
jgi:hypothetical protein